ncbi:hypothetical protein NDU88_005309 [Pleurodeles waltl]|uniref:Uncharacterized protein n=1 Tax=Pleurodeles waltl TaxID=8319 RepID=A0AAV7UI76_PLEWA|nr:hypothetical protein NDU88_005309 [Pleurodeles waltl]
MKRTRSVGKKNRLAGRRCAGMTQRPPSERNKLATRSKTNATPLRAAILTALIGVRIERCVCERSSTPVTGRAHCRSRQESVEVGCLAACAGGGKLV